MLGCVRAGRRGCGISERGRGSQKHLSSAVFSLQAHLYSKTHPGGSGVTLECTPEPPSGRKMTGRNHWSQVPLTGGENPRVVVPLRGRSHPGHQNIPQRTGSPFALERWRYPREEVAKGEMGTALFDPRRCVRESWILFSPGWIHPSVLPIPSAPPRAVSVGPQAVVLTSFSSLPLARPFPALPRLGLY